MTEIKKQYGIWTGIAMVVGIVIGSGVFLKAGGVLKLAGGNLKLSILAWFIGGLIMITSSFCFAVFATKVTKYNGVVDYVEVASNEKIGYSLAWMITSFYYPIVASIVALFAGSYFFKMIGLNIGLTDWQNFLFAFGIITLVVIMNYLSPIIASRFQISATVVKLIPILLIAIGGLFASLIVGNDYGIINAFKNNAELKDSKKNLPKALVGGTIAILVFYIVYYVSLSAILGNEANIIQDEKAPIVAFQKMFGTIGGSIFTFFIMISCLGTVNGVTMGCCRGMYTMSCRGQGIAPEKFSKIGKNKNISFLSCIYGYGCILLMLLVWYLAMHNVWIFGHLGSMDEIICAIIYAIYITMYIFIMKNFKELNVVKRFILPGLAIIGSLFFTICGTGLYQLITTGKTNSLIDFLVFLVLFIILMLPSLFFYHKDGKKETIDD